MYPIYLDYIAASPLLPEVQTAMAPFFSEFFGNPQSRHGLGATPRQAIEDARTQVASLIGCASREIVFTASGSEANNLAIQGLLAAYPKRGRHIITTEIEHYSVAHPIKYLEQTGYSVTWLPVDREGRVSAQAVADAICDDTVLVSIAHANNEVGTLQSLAEIAEITTKTGVFFHTDAVATIGVIPFDCRTLSVDLAAFSAQSFSGPKGVGALFLRRGTRIHPLIAGGIQEEGRRAGTENVAGIVGMGIAANIAHSRMENEVPRLRVLKERLITGLLAQVPFMHLTGAKQNRLPHIASFAVEYLDGSALIKTLEQHNIFAASGSSCSTDALKISPVLTAMGLPGNVAQGGIVFSFGLHTTTAEIEQVISVFPACVSRIRQVSPLFAERLAETAKT
ncbi:Cysteine desulfurase [hydrothermal vent metagenome]|uniref:Cysteine desulfurase n=1 Tax=hydrothermal vent metagenome TaxID=652676 RepID=A0A3B1CTD3_9ZZZZ